MPEVEKERSWLNILSLGLLGDDGDDSGEE